MKNLDYLPQNYDSIKVVDSWDALLSEPFDDASCILFPRTLSGDFNALARAISMQRKGYRKDIPQNLETEHRFLMEDIERVRAHLTAIGVSAFEPSLRIEHRARWSSFSSVDTWHVDGCKNPEFGRLLCNYNAPTTQWLRQQDVTYDSLSMRANERFNKKMFAKTYSFEPGDVWRQRSASSPVSEHMQDRDKLFVHRRPPGVKLRHRNDPPRMLMVAG